MSISTKLQCGVQGHDSSQLYSVWDIDIYVDEQHTTVRPEIRTVNDLVAAVDKAHSYWCRCGSTLGPAAWRADLPMGQEPNAALAWYIPHEDQLLDGTTSLEAANLTELPGRRIHLVVGTKVPPGMFNWDEVSQAVSDASAAICVAWRARILPETSEFPEILRTAGCYYVERFDWIMDTLGGEADVNTRIPIIRRPPGFGRSTFLSAYASYCDGVPDLRLFPGLRDAEYRIIPRTLLVFHLDFSQLRLLETMPDEEMHAECLRFIQSDATAFVAEVLNQARAMLADEASEWNKANSLRPFPPEILGMCFAFLPLQDRVTASHVSRAWRNLALSTPSLWADIRLSPDGVSPSTALVKLALSRSGNAPIDIFVPRRHVDEDLEIALRSAFCRIRSFNATGSAYSHSFWKQPAPVLEKWHCPFGLDIPADLFGGRAGRLTVLHAFGLHVPSTCPALSTLTYVKVRAVSISCLERLFALCPTLVSVTVQRISGNAPQSPFRVPQSLEYLDLHADGYYGYDAVGEPIAVYQACSSTPTPRLRVVNLRFTCRREGENVAPVLAGAVDLNVEFTFDRDRITLITRFAGGRRVSTSIWRMLEHEYRELRDGRFPPIFKQTAACFSELQAVSLPITLLAPFVADAPPIPSLQELRLLILENMVLAFHALPHPGFPWHLLHPLGSVHARHVILHVARPATDEGDESDVEHGESQAPSGVADPAPLTVQDGSAMLSELLAANIAPGQLAITVRGFGREVAEQLIPHNLTVSLSFDTGSG
ncbi:hypothetical protein AURDEDRAFT_181806 [Auricularia subglabra TFB-10046 SS5]|nr:hypothetical protein AURDEDRAFT_181806 [Auricularia subglabra TFB-10046 SS5]